MALVNKRIIDLPERTILRSDDYVAVDSSDGGTAKYNITELETAVDDVAPIIVNTSPTASVLALMDGAEDKAVKKLTLNLLPHQAGSGAPSPSNVRAISGYDTVTVTRTGKNLVPRLNSSKTVSGVTYTPLEDGAIKVQGTSTGQSPMYFWGGDNSPLKEGTYTISATGGLASTGVRVVISVYRASGRTEYYEVMQDGYQATFTIKEGDKTACYMRTDGGNVSIDTVVYPMIRLASISDPTYEPYQYDTYPITLPQTVYGGELDAVSGVLKVTKASYVMTEITQVGWNGALLYIDLSKAPLNKSDANNVLCVCSHAQGVSNDYFYRHQSEDALASVGTARQLRYRNLSIEQTATAYNAYFAQQIANGTPVTFVYEIDTPIEITLDPTTIKTLLGTNTIWMSADGTIQAEYCADTKMYIDALSAPDDDMVANSNIANGKYFTVNNKLYISTSAIAQGEQIIVGTNCTQTDLATALNALNA